MTKEDDMRPSAGSPSARNGTRFDERACLDYDPFSGDRDPVRMLADKIVTARKGGPCCICFEQIKPGERIRTQSAIVDGRAASCRMCEACCVAMAASWDDMGRAIEHRTTMGMVKTGALSACAQEGNEQK